MAWLLRMPEVAANAVEAVLASLEAKDSLSGRRGRADDPAGGAHRARGRDVHPRLGRVGDQPAGQSVVDGLPVRGRHRGGERPGLRGDDTMIEPRRDDRRC